MPENSRPKTPKPGNARLSTDAFEAETKRGERSKKAKIKQKYTYFQTPFQNKAAQHFDAPPPRRWICKVRYLLCFGRNLVCFVWGSQSVIESLVMQAAGLAAETACQVDWTYYYGESCPSPK